MTALALAVVVSAAAATTTLTPLATPAGSPPERAAPPRVAVVVGANAAAPGRRPLRFGHRDAEKMAAVLTAVSGFRPENVTVLRDPHPDQLLRAVSAGIGELADRPDALFIFYYSGHADDRMVYPRGEALALDRIRKLIDDAPVAVRIGMVDACRGGTWTRAKGMSVAEPFPVEWPVSLGSEGSVLIASSSGLENAHESDRLEGSFFTYHFVAALRGAADGNGNRQVTLNEAFDYARDRTIRDTLHQTREVQHPSYAVNLRGRRDIVLAQIDASPSTVELAQDTGPMQVIQLDTGVPILELPAGKRRVRLAVPPGRYLVRKPDRDTMLVKEILVQPDIVHVVEEAHLTLVGSARLAAKSAEPPPPPSPLVSATARTPAPERPATAGASRLVKVAAVSSLVLGAVAWGLGVKYGADVRDINSELDDYRRFPCNMSDTGLCNPRQQPAKQLTQAQVNYVTLKKADGRHLETLQYVAYGTGAALVLGSIPLFWKWVRDEYQAPAVQVGLVPVLPVTAGGAPGLAITGRF
jgi:hypothetical protein